MTPRHEGDDAEEIALEKAYERQYKSKNGSSDVVTWKLLIIIACVAAFAVPSAVVIGERFGTSERQIEVNTVRLDVLEMQMREVQTRDATTTVRLAPIEKRLDQLENWQNQVKSRP